MTTSNLNIDAELKRIRSEYAEALKISEHRGVPVYYTLSVKKLHIMQSTLMEIIESLKYPVTEREVEQCGMAAALYSAISSVINSIADF